MDGSPTTRPGWTLTMISPSPSEPAPSSTKLTSARQRLRGSGRARNWSRWRTSSQHSVSETSTPTIEWRYANWATAPAGSRTTAARQARRLCRFSPCASRSSSTPALSESAAANGPSAPGSTSARECIRLCRKRGKIPAATSISPTTVQAVPTITGTAAGRGPWSNRRTRCGTDTDLSPSSVTDIASRGFA